eukprot:m.313035 g.313035  ORF g.313035 m.313035 type:complete len:62 (-) comp15968_c0_seq40:4900-5085(-)
MWRYVHMVQKGAESKFVFLNVVHGVFPAWLSAFDSWQHSSRARDTARSTSIRSARVHVSRG